MKPRTGTKPSATQKRPAHPPAATQPRALAVLAAAAFTLLAAALCARPLLSDTRTVVVTDIFDPAISWWNNSPIAMYAAHLVAATGLVAGAAWVALARRRWHYSGLEFGAALLVFAGLLSVPAASDHRLAINMAVQMVLPLIAAAMLYQLLTHRLLWRRLLLAGLIAVAAVSCYKATAQKLWEYDRNWQAYLQTKDQYWRSMGKDPSGGEAKVIEAQMLANQPTACFTHPNVLAAFLELGLTCAAAAATALIRPRRPRPSPTPDTPPMGATGSLPASAVLQPDRHAWPTALAAFALVAMTLWPLIVIRWIGSAGAIAALLAAALTAVLACWWRTRPKRLAIALLAGLALLQIVLIGLALYAPTLAPRLAARGGKAKSLALRLNYWNGALQLFAAEPITGIGPGQMAARYLSVKPIYATEEITHAHNWLLNQAAEWGAIGVLGLLVALAGSGWIVLRSLSQAPPGSNTLGQAFLLAGLVALLVHASVEMASAVAGAMWPFWAMVALAMSWTPSAPEPAPLHRPPIRPAFALPILAALATLLLTVPALRSIARMNQARLLMAQSPEQTVPLLREAASIDPQDPAPLNAAGLVRHRLSTFDPSRAAEHLHDARRLYTDALQRSPMDCMLWRSLAAADAQLAPLSSDPAISAEAIRAMHQSLSLYPNSPQGWAELARIAAAQAARYPNQPDLRRTARLAADKALALDDAWPADDLRKFSPADRARLRTMIERSPRSPAPAATQPAAK